MTSAIFIIAAIITALVAGLLIHRLLRRHRKRTESHSPIAIKPPAPSQQAPLPTKKAPLSVRLLYRNSRGEESWYVGTLLSRKPDHEGERTVNLRVQGETFVKAFLMERMQHLELLDDGLVLEDTTSIRRELMIRLPIGRTRQQASKTPSTAPRSVAVPVAKAERPLVKQRKRPQSLIQLLPDGSDGFAVFDLETTSKSTTSARIVEIAIVLIDRDGTVEEEWHSLVNPGERIPNSTIHGINDNMAQQAPLFRELAPLIARKLANRVLVAHNLRSYDLPILQLHFEEIPGLRLHLGDGIDTMPNPRQKLQLLCNDHGISFSETDAHTAIGDSRGLAALLKALPNHLQAAESSVQLLCSLPEKTSVTSLRRTDVNSATVEQTITDSTTRINWQEANLELQPGMMFIATGPKSTARNTEIHRAEAHAENLGLIYRKCNTIPKRERPAFLLSTSLDINTSKMKQAKEQGVPVVLASQLMHCSQGDQVNTYHWVSRNGQA